MKGLIYFLMYFLLFLYKYYILTLCFIVLKLASLLRDIAIPFWGPREELKNKDKGICFILLNIFN